MLAIRNADLDSKTLQSGGLDLRNLGIAPLEMHAGEHVLAQMDFAATTMDACDFGIPLASLDASCDASAWISNQAPRISHCSDNLTLKQTDHLLFGSIRLPAEKIEQATNLAYRSIQKTIQQHPGFKLIRLWNFFPGINTEDEGIERYRLFSRARHDVMASSGYRMSSDLPAACAVGSQEGPLVVHFLAGNGNMRTLENPRQVSAYCYPKTYGPRSPSFSRAVLYSSEQGRQLFFSGTSSILGHETIAPLDPEMQTRITLDNLAALLESAKYPPIRTLGSVASWVVYIRDPAHTHLIKALMADRLHPEARVVFLQGDICRRELMVEIEGTIFC